MVLSRVFAFILLFAIRCRFPSSKSIADIIRSRYNEETLTKVRKLEKVDYKTRKCKLDLEFLEICLANNITPKFLNFKVTNSLLRESKAYRDCQLKLLKQEISNKKSQYRGKVTEFSVVRNDLVRTLSLVDYMHVITLFGNSNEKILDKVQSTHKKKLYELGYFEKDKAVNDPNQVIRNYSSYNLSDTEKSLLAKGLNFSLPPKILNFADYMTPFELLYKNVKNSDTPSQTLDMLKIDMKKVAFASFSRYKFSKELNLSQSEFRALKTLSSQKDIVIQKSDKGNSVVIVNRDDYLNSMYNLISDETKFEKLVVNEDKDYNFMVKEKSIVDKFLSMLYEKNSIDDKLKDSLSPNGPNPARLYGLPKIHKPLVNGIPKYRPIISQIGSPTYKIAKFLLTFITPYTTNEFTVKDTFHFVSMLDGQNHDLYMASLDVDSLFTSIPLVETVDIVTNSVYGRKRKVNGLWKKDFKELLLLSTQGTVFYFDGSYYKQNDGVAMGSPLGPALANAFLCYHERDWLKRCPPTAAPHFYARYVDDIFVLLHSLDDINILCDFLSSQHHNINFTNKVENDNTLDFLDVNVYRDHDRFTTSIHRKDTFSGVYTNFDSFIPDEYKRGLVLTLLHRCYMINSSFQGIHEEIVKLKEILRRNGYTSVDPYIFRFFNKMYDKRDPITTVPKKEVMIVLPFLGSISWYVKNNLVRSLGKVVPYCKLNVVFKTGNRLASHFRYKDTLPKTLQAGVIYYYTCAKCNLSYVGSTKRFWERRLQEHTHVSALTGKHLNGCQVFAPMEHVKSSKCSQSTITRDDFKILGREKNNYLLRVKESLFIYKYRPQLNDHNESTKLYLFH